VFRGRKSVEPRDGKHAADKRIVMVLPFLNLRPMCPKKVFCIFYGLFSGTLVSMTGPALATLSKI
jgi:hypothetical protein